ncbi:MAG TPA: uroporphyrinogen-III synthase [Bacteroidales bacterium]|nr:uroporphyrinogen-III synthase [Bacteroidales bacterium]HPT01721.1 uroporphyrinogen-III synthase [Bacteroidales bacterium]
MKVKNILISQPVPVDLEKSPYAEIIRKYNVNVEFHKFFRVEGVNAREFRDEKVYINEYTAIIFNSKHAVDHFFRIAKEVRIEVPETMKYFCMSESVAYYLQKYVQFRKRKIFHADQDPSQLIDLLKKHKTEKYLIPCSNTYNPELTVLLDATKIEYKTAVLYRTLPDDMRDTVDLAKYDLLVLFSPQGVKSLFYNWPEFKQGEKLIGAFGVNTAQAATEAGLVVNIPAPTATAPSMAMAIDQFIVKNCKK